MQPVSLCGRAGQCHIGVDQFDATGGRRVFQVRPVRIRVMVETATPYCLASARAETELARTCSTIARKARFIVSALPASVPSPR